VTNSVLKDVAFGGSSRQDLRRFPRDARREAGYQLKRVQAGETPTYWKPMRGIGSDAAVPGRRYQEKPLMKTYKSVWDAIESSPSAAASMKAKSQLMRALDKTVRTWGVSQKAAAERLGLSQPRLNDLLRGKIEKFSLDTLFDLAGRSGLKVSLALRKAA
jgi:predicted XRE-type DNA-binding protein